MRKIKIIQVLPTIVYGDAVSNDTLNIDRILKKNGFETEIYAENIGEKIKNVNKYNELKEISKDDILIYHKSTGTDISFQIARFNCKKVIRYHNITPSKYFKNYNEIAYNLVEYGRKGLEHLSLNVDYSLADSNYNARELKNLGYKNIEVLPVLISFKDYEKEPDKKVIKKYLDGKKNILFVGRIAPNKAQEDVIKSFYYYKKYVNKDSRLILVGNDSGFEKYSELLRKLVKELGLENDIVFPGHIKFEEILAFYKVADLFLCMSEHEGFCVPLVESMFFEVPILAYNSSAIKDTLGNSGVIVNKKDYFLISELMNYILSDENVKKEIIKNQNKRLEDFKLEKVEKQLLGFIKRIGG